MWISHKYTTCTFLELELSIPNVVNGIQHIYVQKLQDLGILLGLQASDINMIMQYDLKERHQRLVEMWFVRDPNRSWENLRRAIDMLVEPTRVSGTIISYSMKCIVNFEHFNNVYQCQPVHIF